MGEHRSQSVLTGSDNISQCSHSITAGSIHDIKPADRELSNKLASAKESHFMIWSGIFADLIGPKGKLEKIQSFGEGERNVHEAPAYLPETNELLFSDTTIVGWLWAVNVDTHEAR